MRISPWLSDFRPRYRRLQAGAAQAEAQSQEAIDTFRRAAGVCLEGREYTVQ